MRIHLAGVIFKVSRISRVRSENEHGHYGAAALTRNELALHHFLGFRGARRKIDRASAFRSFAHSRFHPASQFEPQGFEDRCPLRGHWVGLGRMDHQLLRRKYGSAHHPILVAKCALTCPAHDVETRTPMHWKDTASRKIRLVAIESRSCFSPWKVNQKDHKICAAVTLTDQPRGSGRKAGYSDHAGYMNGRVESRVLNACNDPVPGRESFEYHS
jgi:hypothetical protein